MDYNALALGIDLVTRNMDKRSLSNLLEIFYHPFSDMILF